MRVLAFILLAIVTLYAKEDDLDVLLDTFTYNSDLSNKTKLENSGISYIFTRQDLEMMQVKELKDVLKMINYRQSSYGLFDPNYNKKLAFAFNSSSIRLFLNDFEITSAVYGSGIAQMGDFDLSFIDHIEVYMLNPSFEFTTESASVLIKLFSLDTKRDKGGKLLASLGSRGFTQNSLVYVESFQDWDFLTSFSYTEDEKKRHKSLDKPLSRDQFKKHLFFTLKSEHHNFQGAYFEKSGDAFINMSLDATPLSDDTKNKNYSIGYQNSYFDNLRLLINYEYEESFGYFADDNPYFVHPMFGPVRSFLFRSDNSVFTSELKYNYRNENNDLLVGLKYRNRTFDPQETSINGINLPNPTFDRQSYYSAYLEERYMIDENSILNIGYQSSDVQQNGAYDDYTIHLLRMGYTYSLDDFTAKLYYYNSKLPIEPYILQTDLLDDKNPLRALEKNSAALEVKYSSDKYTARAILVHSKTKNGIKFDTHRRKYVNIANAFNTLSPTFEYTYMFDVKNKLLTHLTYTKIDSSSELDETEQWNGFLRLLNSYNGFDFFNEIVFNRVSGLKNFYNYSLGFNYRLSDELLLSVKGENILDKAYEVEYPRIDATRFPPSSLQSLFISPIDPRVIVSMKYYF